MRSILINPGQHLFVNLNPTDIKQVIMNILNNAKDIFIERSIKEKQITITIDEKMKSLSICDSGGGVPIEILDRVFEPYFTTKEQGKGTGIGLYLSKSIIDNLGGNLRVNNTNSGACFTINFKQ